MAGAELMSVLWPPMLCSSGLRAPRLSCCPPWDRTAAAAEPPHQAPGRSPARLELRGHQGTLVHALPPQGQGHTL